MVTVIIVNWNSGDLLRQCLNDLGRQSLTPARIMVVDNGSTDGSQKAANGDAGIELHCMGSNLGFAAANNYALELVDTEFVALLNPDAFPEADWLIELVTAAQTYNNVAAFGSLQMMHNVDGVIDGVGDSYHISGLVWRRGHGVQKSCLEDTAVEVFSPCAGAALYRTDALRSVGLFDEDFFCYIEDIDIGFRLRLQGYKAMFVPSAVVSHVGAAMSGGRHSDFAVYHGHRNLAWAYIKNMPGLLFWICLPLHFLLTIFEVIKFVVSGQYVPILRAKRDAAYGLAKMWRKRKKIQQQRVVSMYEIWRVLDKRLWLSRK